MFRPLLTFVLLGLAGTSGLFAQARNAELHKVFADYYEDVLRRSPESATFVGRHEYDAKWTDYSPKTIAENLARLRDYRARLAKFQPSQLNEADRVSLEILTRELARSEEGFELNTYYFTVSQMRGPHLTIPSVIAMMPATNVAQYENILARIRGLATLGAQFSELARTAVSKGLVQPKLVVALTQKQLTMQAAAPPEKSPLLRPFFAFPKNIPEAEQTRLRQAAVKSYTEEFQPAWRKFHDVVAAEVAPKARDTIALSALTNGKEHYRHLTKTYTTTNLTPVEIHQIGLREVERIQTEMAAIRKEVNFSGSAAEFVTKVLEAPDMLFKSEAEILAHGREIAKRIDPELPRLFKVLPRSPYGVRAIPADRAQTAAPYYEGPATDGSRAGNFYLRTYQPEKQSKCCMESLIIHEAVPGHHLQIALAREMADMPEFRKVANFTAFAEGWGLYAETLGPELGMYQSPYERYGKLQTEIMRAVRLVVDTGIHELGWTREKAIDLMKLAKGGFITDEFIASEVDRYIAMPGQALAYKVGALEIEGHRKRAEKELGAKFNIRDFHDVILRNGSLPLDVLAKQVDDYLAKAKAGTSAGGKMPLQ